MNSLRSYVNRIIIKVNKQIQANPQSISRSSRWSPIIITRSPRPRATSTTNSPQTQPSKPQAS